MRLKGAFEEKAVGCSLAGGCGLTVVASILAWAFGMGGFLHMTATRNPSTGEVTDPGDMAMVPLMGVFVMLGVLLMIGAVSYGLWRNSRDHAGNRRVEQNFRILARYAYDRGNMLTSDYEIEAAAKPKFYVRGTYQDGTVEELETTYEMYSMSGEGMYGEAEIQGRWMGRFTPYVGGAPAPRNSEEHR